MENLEVENEIRNYLKKFIGDSFYFVHDFFHHEKNLNKVIDYILKIDDVSKSTSLMYFLHLHEHIKKLSYLEPNELKNNELIICETFLSNVEV